MNAYYGTLQGNRNKNKAVNKTEKNLHLPGAKAKTVVHKEIIHIMGESMTDNKRDVAYVTKSKIGRESLTVR